MPSACATISCQSISNIALGGGFSLSPIELRPGFICVQISGPTAEEDFRHESGGHRWQRIPPTEKKGRRHTSTITVAVLREPEPAEVELDYNKLEMSTCRGSGKGGQHRNVTDSAVQIKYNNIIVRCESERSQHQNKRAAIAVLRARLLNQKEEQQGQIVNQARKNQIGSGMRGDKIRTVRVFDNQVKDHATNKKMSYEKYKRGFIEKLHS